MHKQVKDAIKVLSDAVEKYHHGSFLNKKQYDKAYELMRELQTMLLTADRKYDASQGKHN